MHDISVSEQPLLRPLARVGLAMMMHLPYALERTLLAPLLGRLFFEPATPAQLAAISALWASEVGTAGSPTVQLGAAALAAVLNGTASSLIGHTLDLSTGKPLLPRIGSATHTEL